MFSFFSPPSSSIIEMADKMTRGMWFNPIIIDDDEQDPVELEGDPLPSTLPLSNTLPLPNGPPAIPLPNTTYSCRPVWNNAHKKPALPVASGIL
ncbi:uncharacterized protein FMAN_00227 [Fusarium mangiferae]|uniref:Uncharacterized protein n=1 Tax=Fusarium mangiferae TaxID=192010 RepID=A0A1L7U5E9_FUSMA|nr:uncharacterized protein FMAN_00227 [Fusarium mangiferae]CVL02741.1 uncharacterized protein FMAN_00227 [Fusarium mangiferae]